MKRTISLILLVHLLILSPAVSSYADEISATLGDGGFITLGVMSVTKPEGILLITDLGPVDESFNTVISGTTIADYIEGNAMSATKVVALLRMVDPSTTITITDNGDAPWVLEPFRGADIFARTENFFIKITTSTSTAMDIDDVPDMPSATFKAKITPDVSSILSSVTYKWFLDIRFNQGDRSDHTRFPATGTVDVVNNPEWSPSWGSVFEGGEVEAHVEVEIGSTTIKHDKAGFEIQGTQPSRSDVVSELPTDNHKAVAWQESQMSQFGSIGAGDGTIDWPLFGGPHGWGIMQLDPPPSTQEIWHWLDNLTEGITHLDLDFNTAQSYLNNWYDVDATNGDTWTWDPHDPANEDLVWDDAFSRYNTGDPLYSPNGNLGNRNVSANPAGDNYATAVRGHVNSTPW